jgi:hypothetical protein
MEWIYKRIIKLLGLDEKCLLSEHKVLSSSPSTAKKKKKEKKIQ